MRKGNNVVTIVARWRGLSLLIALFSLVGLSKVSAQQIPWTEGVTVQLITAAGSSIANQVLGVNVQNQVVPLGDPAQNVSNKAALWYVLTCKDEVNGTPYIGFQNVQTKNNIQMNPGDGSVFVANANFHNQVNGAQPWERFVLMGSASAYGFKNVVSGNFLSMRPVPNAGGQNGLLRGVDEENTPISWQREWENFTVNVVNATPATITLPQAQAAAVTSGAPSAGIAGSLQWSMIDGLLVQGSINNNSVMWGVSAGNEIWQRIVGSTPWLKVDGASTYISVNDLGQVVCVGTDKGLYVRLGVTASAPQGTGWVRVPGAQQFVSVTINNQSEIIALDSAGYIYSTTMSALATQIPALVSVAAVAPLAQVAPVSTNVVSSEVPEDSEEDSEVQIVAQPVTALTSDQVATTTAVDTTQVVSAPKGKKAKKAAKQAARQAAASQPVVGKAASTTASQSVTKAPATTTKTSKKPKKAAKKAVTAYQPVARRGANTRASQPTTTTAAMTKKANKKTKKAAKAAAAQAPAPAV